MFTIHSKKNILVFQFDTFYREFIQFSLCIGRVKFQYTSLGRRKYVNYNVQGESSLLPPPKKQSKNSPPYLGLCFLGGWQEG